MSDPEALPPVLGDCEGCWWRLGRATPDPDGYGSPMALCRRCARRMRRYRSKVEATERRKRDAAAALVASLQLDRIQASFLGLGFPAYLPLPTLVNRDSESVRYANIGRASLRAAFKGTSIQERETQ